MFTEWGLGLNTISLIFELNYNEWTLKLLTFIICYNYCLPTREYVFDLPPLWPRTLKFFLKIQRFSVPPQAKYLESLFWRARREQKNFRGLFHFCLRFPLPSILGPHIVWIILIFSKTPTATPNFLILCRKVWRVWSDIHMKCRIGFQYSISWWQQRVEKFILEVKWQSTTIKSK